MSSREQDQYEEHLAQKHAEEKALEEKQWEDMMERTQVFQHADGCASYMRIEGICDCGYSATSAKNWMIECLKERALRLSRQKNLWQPIETAPKNGTHVLVWVKANSELGHQANYSHAVDAYWTSHNKGGWVWHGVAGNITHWMPLPEGPNE